MAIGMKEDNAILEEKKVVSSLEDSDMDSPRSNKNNIIIIIAVALIVLVIIAMLKSINADEEEITMGTESAGNAGQILTTESNNLDTATEDPLQITTEVTVGLPEFDPKENGATSATVYSASDYIKDLNGYDIPAVYEVSSRSYIKDFANYEAKRAILADGMEMYWLEITYKEKPYRCQVPFYIFKDLETTGICVVEIELLTLEGGEQIVSFMQVVSNYDDLINK